MADASTIASLATAGGTLVLAIATFSATRSANCSARIAERALDLNLRPVLIPAHEWEPSERISIFLRYADQDGGHDTITRYTLSPDENGNWLFGIGRHWSLD